MKNTNEKDSNMLIQHVVFVHRQTAAVHWLTPSHQCDSWASLLQVKVMQARVIGNFTLAAVVSADACLLWKLTYDIGSRSQIKREIRFIVVFSNAVLVLSSSWVCDSLLNLFVCPDMSICVKGLWFASSAWHQYHGHLCVCVLLIPFHCSHPAAPSSSDYFLLLPDLLFPQRVSGAAHLPGPEGAFLFRVNHLFYLNCSLGSSLVLFHNKAIGILRMKWAVCRGVR